MPRKKKPAPEPPPKTWLEPNERAVQTSRLMESFDTYTKHSIECWLCGKKDFERDITEAKYARQLYAAGWRYVVSNKYQTAGTACKECAQDPEADEPLGDGANWGED